MELDLTGVDPAEAMSYIIYAVIIGAVIVSFMKGHALLGCYLIVLAMAVLSSFIWEHDLS